MNYTENLRDQFTRLHDALSQAAGRPRGWTGEAMDFFVARESGLYEEASLILDRMVKALLAEGDWE